VGDNIGNTLSSDTAVAQHTGPDGCSVGSPSASCVCVPGILCLPENLNELPKQHFADEHHILAAVSLQVVTVLVALEVLSAECKSCPGVVWHVHGLHTSHPPGISEVEVLNGCFVVPKYPCPPLQQQKDWFICNAKRYNRQWRGKLAQHDQQ
jgi:hypothetical protein